MLDKIKFRIIVVALAIGAVWFLYTRGMAIIQPYGDTLAADETTSVLWGYTWITQNIGWLVLIFFALAFVILMAWQIRKDRKG